MAATRQAIADATDFDEREINYNFDYDSEAYDEVKRNLSRLIDQGHLRQAMELSLELMKEGSYQVEMSDEGLMTDDIEECLKVVIKPSRSATCRRAKSSRGARRWSKSDRVGCICDQELRALRDHFEGVAAVMTHRRVFPVSRL